MKELGRTRLLLAGAVVVAISLVSACTTAPPPPPPASAPKYVSRPYPPMGAAPNLTIPPTGVDGTRLTINRALSVRQAVWNLRSAYNVAALNCTKPQYAPILTNYGDFLKKHEKALRSINSALDQDFKAQFGSGYIAKRENFQTQVYNYFALPAVIPALCDTTLAMGPELGAIAPGQLELYAPSSLAKLETVYLDFFDRYDLYRRDFVQWQIDYETKYGSPPPAGYYLPGEPRYQTQTTSFAPASTTVAEPALSLPTGTAQ